jgi:cyclic-di-GMP-binding protein
MNGDGVIFCYSQPRMTTSPKNTPPPTPEANTKSILEWLAQTHAHTKPVVTGELYRQLQILRETPIPTIQRVKFLDLLFGQAAQIVDTDLDTLRAISLPASRKIRHRMKLLLDLLENLTQDYFNTLAALFDPEARNTLRSPQSSLRRAMESIAWQIRIHHLLAAPPRLGLWQQFHTAFRTARRLGVEGMPGPKNGPGIQRVYANTILAGIAQPASFSSIELEFIRKHIEQSSASIEFSSTPPAESTGLFWVDLTKDFPAHALIRRAPAPDINVLYFSCDAIAQSIAQHGIQLANGISAASLGLPVFSETHSGRRVLQRLNLLWGHPSKRKFPRRRQSSRANLCAGLDNLWQLFKTSSAKRTLGEWMITNESPDGYSLMHISGHTENLRVGDIVALQPLAEDTQSTATWQVCIIRWAISENPEHLELGLELLAPKGIAVEITHPDEPTLSNIPALILPATPPFRTVELLAVPAEALKEDTRRVMVQQEQGTLEVRATQLSKQTSAIDIFSVSPDEPA